MQQTSAIDFISHNLYITIVFSIVLAIIWMQKIWLGFNTLSENKLETLVKRKALLMQELNDDKFSQHEKNYLKKTYKMLAFQIHTGMKRISPGLIEIYSMVHFDDFIVDCNIKKGLALYIIIEYDIIKKCFLIKKASYSLLLFLSIGFVILFFHSFYDLLDSTNMFNALAETEKAKVVTSYYVISTIDTIATFASLILGLIYLNKLTDLLKFNKKYKAIIAENTVSS